MSELEPRLDPACRGAITLVRHKLRDNAKRLERRQGGNSLLRSKHVRNLFSVTGCKSSEPSFLSYEAVFARDPAAVARTASNLIDKAFLLASIALVMTLAVWHATASSNAAIFPPFALPEEAAYTFLSAHNYIEHGFFNSLFLQDFATGPDPADHPFVYNHMPAGPDIFLAMLVRATGSNYVGMRAIYSVIAVGGFGVYYLFAEKFLSRLGLVGAGLALLFVGPWTLIQLIDRQIYAPFALLAFLPLLLYVRSIEKGRRGEFYLALAVIFVSSIYCEYSLLSGMAACWGMLFLTRLLPIRVWEITSVAGAFAAGIAIHLIQNMLYLGLPAFFPELLYTLSNRITGFPVQAQLASFYHSLGLVHHGSHPVSVAVLWEQIKRNFSFVGLQPMLVGWAACLAWVGLVPVLSRTVGMKVTAPPFRPLADLSLLFAKLAVFAVGTILTPIVLFPAFAQEVNLRGLGASSFYIGIGFVAMAGVVWSVLLYIARRTVSVALWPKTAAESVSDISDFRSAVVRLVLVFALTASIWVMWTRLDASAREIAGQTLAQLHQINSFRRSKDRWTPLHALERFRGFLFMTNINVPTVGVITKAPGFGVCPPESVEADGGFKLRLCKTAFMKRYDYWTTQRPKYFYYFDTPGLFPGFADCMPLTTLVGQQRRGKRCMDDLLERLSKRYRLIMENRLVKVFDLSQPATGGEH